MTDAKLNTQGLILSEEDFQWLGCPSMVDALHHGADLLICSGSTFPVKQAPWKGAYWVYTEMFRVSGFRVGEYRISQLSEAGRYLCCVHDCAMTFLEGTKKICIRRRQAKG